MPIFRARRAICAIFRRFRPYRASAIQMDERRDVQELKRSPSSLFEQIIESAADGDPDKAKRMLDAYNKTSL